MRTHTLLLCAAVLVSATACEHPIGIVTPHIEAADLVLADSAGEHIARTVFNREWNVDSIVLTDDQPLRLALVPLDFRGLPIEVDARGDISFRMEAEDGALLQWEPLNGFGRLHPFRTGTTRVRFLIWHQTHADFVTPWLRVVVRSAAETKVEAYP